LQLDRAHFAVVYLLLMYLSEMFPSTSAPAARQFGREVLAQSADVLSLNYDHEAEDCIGSASGIGPKPMPDSLRGRERMGVIPDDDLVASHLNWKRSLAHGFRFDEVSLPIAGGSVDIPGDRYYAHPANQLYASTRVLKLHGSIDRLNYTGKELYPGLSDENHPPPPSGLVLHPHPIYWMGSPPTRGRWLMEPLIIPPHLNKNYERHPLRLIWEEALATLSQARILIVVGYSFPPTDFRVRRLFREAFADHSLRQLVAVNPDAGILDTVRELTHFSGPAVTCEDLSSLYGLPRDWFLAVDSLEDQPRTDERRT
jgi:hypothetical protein